jgi:hypothetical protein
MKLLKKQEFKKGQVILTLHALPFKDELEFHMSMSDKYHNDVMVIKDTYQAACAVFVSQAEFIEASSYGDLFSAGEY